MRERSDERLSISQVEGETFPKVVLVFQGTRHDPQNIEGVQDLSQSIDTYFSGSSGVNTLFLEDATGTEDKVRNKKQRLREKDDFLYWETRVILGNESRYPVATKQVEQRIGEIETILTEREDGALSLDAIEEILRRGLIPAKDLFKYFTAREVARARRNYGARIDWETHPSVTHQRGQRIGEQVTALTRSSERSWRQRDFEASYNEFAQTYPLSIELGHIRDQNLMRTERARAEELVRAKAGGRVIYHLGVFHHPMVEGVVKRLGVRAPVVLISDYTKLLGTPRMSAIDEVKNGTVSPELISQSMLEFHIHKLVENEARRKGLVADFALNWETIFDQVGAIAASTPAQDVRSICEIGEPLTSVMAEHPLAPDLQRFIA